MKSATKRRIGCIFAGLVCVVIAASWYLQRGGCYGSFDTMKRVRSDMRNLATAIETYFVDHRNYPQPGPPLSSGTERHFFLRNAGGMDLPSLPATLTTPVSYISNLVKDRYSPHEDATFVYYTDSRGWILVSPGLDCDYDLDPRILDWYAFHTDYSKFRSNLKSSILTYDPTNGLISDGDIWRLKD